MKREELESVYHLWGKDDWPRSRASQYWRTFCETISPDTYWRDMDVVIVGGDPISRFAALRSCGPRERIVFVEPLHPAEASIPWVMERETRMWIAQQFGFEAEDFVEGFASLVQRWVLGHQVYGHVWRTDMQVMYDGGVGVYVANPHRREVYGSVTGIEEMVELHRVLDKGFMQVPRLALRGSLNGGGVGRVLDLSPCSSVKRNRKDFDFTFPIFPVQPMSEARSLWKRRLKTLLSNAEEG